MLIVIAIAVAGCSTQTTTAKSGDSGVVPTTAAAGSATVKVTQPASSSAPVTGSDVTGANIFGTGASYNWIEYKMVTSGMTAYMKFEKSGKCTMRMEGKDLPGGSMTIDCSSKGQTTGQPAQSNPADVKSDVKFTFVGVEPVSVGAGTYPVATKYMATSDGQKTYYWTAAGVPTFVKMQSPSSDGDVIMELNGWG
jgi:hypothetical protein